MDYKYITQLLERYWEGTTSLEEEQILKAFFSQKDIPAELLRYKPLFDYQTAEPRQDVLGDDFDERILSLINEPTPVKAHIITLQQKLKPLFKAAAIVAIGQCGAGFHDRQFGLNSAEQQHECRHT